MRLRELGRGAFGTAWLVHPVGEPGRLLVAKETLIPHGDAGALAAAQHEAAVLAACAHPNIVRAHGSCVERGEPGAGGSGGGSSATRFVLLQEYADGGDVAALIARRRAAAGVLGMGGPTGGRLGVAFTPEATVLDIVAQLCLALDHLHSRCHVLHRDIKPSNVFLTTAGIVKLGDFGVSRRLDLHGSGARTMVGTPLYLSPELARGSPYGRKADMWAVGVLAFELCTGAPPFTAPDVATLLRKISACRVPPLPPAARYSSGLGALVGSLLARDPRARPSARQVLAMEPVRSHLRVLLAATATSTALAGAPLPPPTTWAPPRPRSAPAAEGGDAGGPLPPQPRAGHGPPRAPPTAPSPPPLVGGFALAAARCSPPSSGAGPAMMPPLVAARRHNGGGVAGPAPQTVPRLPPPVAPVDRVLILPAVAPARRERSAPVSPAAAAVGAPASPSAAQARLLAAALHDAIAAERARRAVGAEQRAAQLAEHAAAQRRRRAAGAAGRRDDRRAGLERMRASAPVGPASGGGGGGGGGGGIEIFVPSRRAALCLSGNYVAPDGDNPHAQVDAECPAAADDALSISSRRQLGAAAAGRLYPSPPPPPCAPSSHHQRSEHDDAFSDAAVASVAGALHASVMPAGEVQPASLQEAFARRRTLAAARRRSRADSEHSEPDRAAAAAAAAAVAAAPSLPPPPSPQGAALAPRGLLLARTPPAVVVHSAASPPTRAADPTVALGDARQRGVRPQLAPPPAAGPVCSSSLRRALPDTPEIHAALLAESAWLGSASAVQPGGVGASVTHPEGRLDDAGLARGPPARLGESSLDAAPLARPLITPGLVASLSDAAEMIEILQCALAKFEAVDSPQTARGGCVSSDPPLRSQSSHELSLPAPEESHARPGPLAAATSDLLPSTQELASAFDATALGGRRAGGGDACSDSDGASEAVLRGPTPVVATLESIVSAYFDEGDSLDSSSSGDDDGDDDDDDTSEWSSDSPAPAPAAAAAPQDGRHAIIAAAAAARACGGITGTSLVAGGSGPGRGGAGSESHRDSSRRRPRRDRDFRRLALPFQT